MKLFKYAYTRLFGVIVIALLLWGALFYLSMITEIMDETDDRLLNNKGLVVHRFLQNPQRLLTTDTVSDNYHIKRINEQQGLNHQDKFYDTTIFIQIENEYEPMRVFNSSFKDGNGQFYEIELYLSTIERDNVIENILLYLLFLFVLVLGIVFVAVRMVLKRTFGPLYKLLEWINALVPGKDTPELLNETEITEFKMLNLALVNMQNRSRKAYEEQKDFIGNASHELQTPLAIALNKLDLLANSGELSEQQMTLIAATYQTLQRATRLNKALLLLSQIQNEQFESHTTMRLNEMAKPIAEDLIEMYAHKNLSLQHTGNQTFEVDMNDTLANILITNLLKNAVLHAPHNSQIIIHSTSDTLTISNDGAEALDGEKIFRRFYRSENATSQHSTGLGLTIAKEITQLYKLSLDYYYNQKHLFVLKK